MSRKIYLKSKIKIVTEDILKLENMCGIIGYIGKKNALPIVLSGLRNLEYRGYDSSGIAYKKEKIEIIKASGKLVELENILPNDYSNMAIGHTRWATHGKANKINAHPHKIGRITIVHNGIIENYQELKNFLITKGYQFQSETDTEIVAGVIDYYYDLDKDIIKTLERLKSLLKGSYALGILVNGINKIYAVKCKSPLIIGIGDNEYFMASDIPAILEYTNKYILLDDNDICELGESIKIVNNNQEIKHPINEYNDSLLNDNLGNYPHYMLKEINEEPVVINRLIKDILSSDTIDLLDYDDIQIVACGSAYHAGLVGKNLIEKYLNIKTNAYIASEYRYNKNFYTNKSLVIAISQSGETADTLASVLLAKENNIHTLGIINTVASSIAREVDEVLYIKAGIEKSVATTKAYTLQVLMFSLLIYKSLIKHQLISKEEEREIFDSFNNLSIEVSNVFNMNLDKYANKLYNHNNIFFIGRGVDYALSMEASLKLKEISYIHSEAYPAGELKHGTISLITDEIPVIGIITDDNIREKTLSNIKEVESRGAYTLILTDEEIKSNEIIKIEKVHDLVSPILAIVPFQLLAYKIAVLRECDIDKPRNLAKSVTVE